MHHGQEVRVCESCGKDLPRSASRRMKYHAHCARREAKRRERAKQDNPRTSNKRREPHNGSDGHSTEAKRC
jgi:hypothetical protein